MQTKYTTEELKRFWGKVDKISNPNNCWIWTAYKWRGYGKFGWHGKIYLAHRISYELAFGEFDPTLDILHKCDNPACVNPDHLFSGTHLDNMRDMINKGRDYKFQHFTGEKSAHHKLTDKQVVEIRLRYKNEKITQKQLGEIYKVDQTQISHIVLNKQRILDASQTTH